MLNLLVRFLGAGVVPAYPTSRSAPYNCPSGLRRPCAKNLRTSDRPRPSKLTRYLTCRLRSQELESSQTIAHQLLGAVQLLVRYAAPVWQKLADVRWAKFVHANC